MTDESDAPRTGAKPEPTLKLKFISHGTLECRDLAFTRRFYEEFLGFEVVQIHPYGAIDTVTRYGGWSVPGPVRKPVAFSLDSLPVVRQLGSTCIWVGRKRAGA